MTKIIKIAFMAALVGFLINPVFSQDFSKEKEEVRIQNVMNKIKNGEDVKVIALGGSITTGYSANPINKKSWSALTNQYLAELAQSNNCKLTYKNFGVAGTDSAFAIQRLQDHVLNENPDLLILEFAMNDQWLDPKVRQKTYEAVIRKTMDGTNTAILALFVNERAAPYASNQKEQQKICEYYHIPFVSWKDCMERDNRLSDFESCFDGTETVHPNTKGHGVIASYIQAKLEEIWNKTLQNKDIPVPVKNLPAALTDNSYVNAKYYHVDNIEPVVNTGWVNGSPVHPEWLKHGNSHKGWEAVDAGAEITFEVEGTGVGITYCESDQFRDAIAWVTLEDGTNTTKIPLQCYSAYRKGYLGWAYKELVSKDSLQKFTVHIQCNKRAPKASEGKKCNITGLIVTGEK